MKYRWKLLILLLGLSLGPILIARVFGVKSVHRLGQELVDGSRKRILEDTENRLRMLVDAYSRIIWKDREYVELALTLQAAEVEKALRSAPPDPGRVYFARDFNPGADPPADTAPSRLHVRTGTDGAPEMLRVSYDNQMFQLPRGAAGPQAAADIPGLFTLTPVYRQLNTRVRPLVLWHYTILENGLHSAYPAHGGMPGNIDFRHQPWYRQALEEKTPWTDPYVDPQTGQVVISAAVPIFRPDGRMAGVTAMVISIRELMDRSRFIEALPPAAEAYLGYIAPRPEDGRPGVRIFAQKDHADIRHRSWRYPMDADWLDTGDPESFSAMIRDIQNGVADLRYMTHNDCGCLWAYGPIHDSALLVVIIPESVIFAPAETASLAVEDRINGLLEATGYGLAALVLLVTAAAFAFSRNVTRPLQALVDASIQMAEGDFDTRVDIRSKDEFGEMGRVFNAVVPKLDAFTRMNRSMVLAREVQQSLLPTAAPSAPGLDIAGKTISCDETGGDYYDFLERGRPGVPVWAVVVGDVSDHGLPSALLMASARAYLRQRSSMPGGIASVVADVNRQLTRDVEASGRFMTLLMCELDTAGGRLSWVRAGHDPGIAYDPETDQFQALDGPGMALGVIKDAVYRTCSAPLIPGGIVAIGTDGIWEARDPGGRMFGKERLHHIIRGNADQTAAGILDAVISAVFAFRRSSAQTDDITLVVVKRDRSGRLP